MAIEVSPRNGEALLELDIFQETDSLGVTDLELAYNDFILKSPQSFSPFDASTFDSMIRLCAANLDSKGTYWPDHSTAEDRKLPDISEGLKITDTWVLFARPRTNTNFKNF